MSQPLVSIILPTRNRSALLRRAVESVQRQSCGSWELLIVDDGSTDDTPRLMEEFSADPRVRAIRQAESGGASGARNRGIEQLGGSCYLAFLDDDDE
jgi:glycosyltransferase involved in cell wall biosynthesis